MSATSLLELHCTADQRSRVDGDARSMSESIECTDAILMGLSINNYPGSVSDTKAKRPSSHPFGLDQWPLSDCSRKSCGLKADFQSL